MGVDISRQIYRHRLESDVLTANRIITFPDADSSVALIGGNVTFATLGVTGAATFAAELRGPDTDIKVLRGYGSANRPLQSVAGVGETDYRKLALVTGAQANFTDPTAEAPAPAINSQVWMRPNSPTTPGASQGAAHFMFLGRGGTDADGAGDISDMFNLFLQTETRSGSSRGLNSHQNTIGLGVYAKDGSGAAHQNIYGILTNNVLTNTDGYAIGLEIEMKNVTGVDAPAQGSNTGAADNSLIGLNIANGGGNKATAAIMIQNTGSLATAFRTGFHLQPNSASEYGIDLKYLNTSAVPMRIANATFLTGRNAADGADLAIIGLNSSNQASLPQNTLGAGFIKSTSPTAGIGYATGAGGTVTQGSGSGKATGVTLNAACGKITMDGAALAAGANINFVLTNSAIASGDILMVTHVSGTYIAKYDFQAAAVGGAATINVENRTAGSLSEAVPIRFTVIKGVEA